MENKMPEHYSRRLLNYFQEIDRKSGELISEGAENRFYPQFYGETVIGVEVDYRSLPQDPFIPISAFLSVIILLLQSDSHSATTGSAMLGRLGEEILSLKSVEGYIAYNIYGHNEGDSVYRRTSPIINILINSGVCKKEDSKLVLVNT